MKPTGSVNIEIIVTGDEIMYGRILDTNSRWIAQRVAEIGARLKRITAIGDELNTISSTLLEALKRDAHFILITGGLGPSEDDLTVSSIGMALDRKIIIDPIGAEKIRKVYENRGISDEASIRRGERMARILEGSQPLQNPVGLSVGMKVEAASKTILTLPGVQDEMKEIFKVHVAEMIKTHANSVFLAETYNITMAWKDFFPLYREMQKDYSDVYIKNAATPPIEEEERNKQHTIKVDIVLEAINVEKAHEQMRNLVFDYKRRIESLGNGRMEYIPDK
jgi:molybdenum cofactor synthesis domain-containing protein